MNASTVIVRDLRRLARRKGTFVGRSLIAGIAFLSFCLTTFAVDFGFVTGFPKGKAVVLVLGIVLTVGCAFWGVILTSDCLSEERRQGTLGLLFLTPLTRMDLLVGRLISASWSSVYGVIGLVPIIAMAMLFGGVAISEFVRLSVVIMNTLFLSLVCGMVVSSGVRDARRALSTALFLMAAIVVGPFLLIAFVDIVTESPQRPDIWPVMMISPLYALVYSGCLQSWGYDGRLFFCSIGAGQVIAWSLFLASSALLRRSFQSERERESANPKGARSVALKRLTPRRRRNRTTRSRWLEPAPVAWLLGRDITKKLRIEGYLIALLVIGILTHRALPQYIEFQLLLLFVAAVFLKVWFLIEVVTRFRDERSLGSFELLLTSPQGVPGILEGTNKGLCRLFGRGFGVVVLIALAIYFLAEFPKSAATLEGYRLVLLPYIVGIALDLWALKWAGMWSAVAAKGSNRAYLGPVASILCLPWVLLLLVGGALALFRELSGVADADVRIGESVVLWMGSSYPIALVVGWRARTLFRNQIAFLAQSAFDLRSAEAEWLRSLETSGASRRRWYRRLPWPRTFRRQAIAVALVVLSSLVVFTQGRRIYYERELRRELASFPIPQEPMPEVWFGAPQDFGKLPGPLFDIVANLVLPRTVPTVDMAALEPALSRAPKWNKTVSREERLAMLRAIRSRDAKGLEALAALDESVLETEAVEQKSFMSWNHARSVEILFDVLGCEVYYHALDGSSSRATQALITMARLKTLLIEKENSLLRGLGLDLNQFESGLRLVFSVGGFEEDDLVVLDHFLQRIVVKTSALAALRNRFQFLEAYVGFHPRWRSLRQNPEESLALIVFTLRRLSGLDSKAWREMVPWAVQMIESLEKVEDGEPTAYQEFGAEIRELLTARRISSLFSMVEGIRQGSIRDADRFIDQLARLRLMRCGVAIERFRLRTGRLPQSLSELPGFPNEDRWTDPYSGDHFEYEVVGEGYSLRSKETWTLSYMRESIENRVSSWEVPVHPAALAE